MGSRLRRNIRSSPVMMRVKSPLSRLKALALIRAPIVGKIPVIAHDACVDAVGLESQSDYLEWAATNSEIISLWTSEEDRLIPTGCSEFTVPGFCALCGGVVNFIVTGDYGGKGNGKKFGLIGVNN